MISEFLTPVLNIFSQMGYVGIIVLMTMESSIFPVPSELVIPPFAYLASQGELNIFLVVFCGVLGSYLGACLNYFVSKKIGRPVVYSFAKTKFAKILFISEEKIKKSEEYFNKYGNISTFIGRLIPVVRHLISIPAGLSNMNFFNFSLYTILGATIWNIILALMGYFIGTNIELLKNNYNELSNILWGIGILTVLFFVIKYFFFDKKIKK